MVCLIRYHLMYWSCNVRCLFSINHLKVFMSNPSLVLFLPTRYSPTNYYLT